LQENQNIEQNILNENLNSNQQNINSKTDNQNSHEIEKNSIQSTNFFFSNESYASNVSYDKLKEYVKYPMIYNRVLREVSRVLYNSNGMYANVIDYCIAIPTLDYVTILRKKEYKNKKDKKKDKEKKTRFDLLVKQINHKRATRDILRHQLIDGIYVGILRNTKQSNKNLKPPVGMLDSMDRIEGLSLDDNLMIQPLDVDYCKIIGFQNNSCIAAFDMMYFDQFKHGGLVNEIKNYPKDFLRAYKEYKKDASKRWFILNPKSTIALKFRSNEDEPYGRPYGLAAFTRINFAEDYENSQYKLINELASSIYALLLPEGEIKGKSSLNKDQQQSLIDSFNSAVKVNTSTNQAKITTITLPPGAKIERVSKDASLLKDTLSEENMKRISTHLGFASSALNASAEGGASYANLAVNLDLISSQIFQCIEDISTEFTRVFNESDIIGIDNPNEYIDFKYLKISVFNADKMYGRAKEMYTQSMGSIKVLANCASFGLDSNDYLNIMEEELDDGIFERFKPHPTSFTMSDNGADVGGRPQKETEDLTKEGLATRNSGSNEQLKPSTT
jgi:hypothetical protein